MSRYEQVLNCTTVGRLLPPQTILATAKRTGFKWVELNSMQTRFLNMHDASEVKDAFAEAGVSLATFFVPVAWREVEVVFEADLVKYDELLTKLEPTGLEHSVTWLPTNFPTPPAETREWVGKRFKRIAEVNAAHGLKFGLESIGEAHYREEPGHTFIYTPGKMQEFATEIADNVGVVVDTYHWHCAGETTADLAALSPDRLLYVHMNDARPGPRDGLRDNERLFPGDGVIDINGFLDGLADCGYRGRIAVELDSYLGTTSGPGALATRSRETLDAVLATWEKHRAALV
mgnify:CR=1 FL=1